MNTFESEQSIALVQAIKKQGTKMALFTADLNNECDQIKAALNKVVEESLLPALQTLVNKDIKPAISTLVQKDIKPAISTLVQKDIKPAASELLIETRYHSAWIIKEAGAETQALVNLFDEKATQSIELVDEKLSKQINQIDDLLTKQTDKIDISLSNKLHQVEGMLTQNINEINDCISAQAETFHKELRKTILFGTICGAGLLVVAALLYRFVAI